MNARLPRGRRAPRVLRICSSIAILIAFGLLAAEAAASTWGSSANTIPVVTVRAKAFAAQPTQLHYDPQTREVTIRTSLRDLPKESGLDIRRNSFIVYENGVHQRDVSVSVEHRPISIGMLLEYGGRYHVLTEGLADFIPAAANRLLDEIGSHDEVSIWKYGDGLEPLAIPVHEPSPDQPHLTPAASLSRALPDLGTPPISETNFYDALIASLSRVQAMSDPKALIVVSTGIDTFSQASYPDVLQAVRTARVPIYVINIGPALRASLNLYSQDEAPYARLNWSRAQAQLARIARESGGRLYEPASSLDLAAIYDGLFSDLRIEYVIRYKSGADSRNTRTVRVDVIGPNGARGLVAASQVPDTSVPPSQGTARAHA